MFSTFVIVFNLVKNLVQNQAIFAQTDNTHTATPFHKVEKLKFHN